MNPPKSLPTTAVMLMANAPQKTTLKVPLTLEAPPTYAAVAPKMPSVIRAVIDTISTIKLGGASRAAMKGIIAPKVNEQAETSAA